MGNVTQDAGSGRSAIAATPGGGRAPGPGLEPLNALQFLLGQWHGQGNGPQGAYDFETRVAVRGRWQLLTTDVFAPNSQTLLYASTQVYGYDDDGLTLCLFDTAGSFDFRDSSRETGVRFEWQDGEAWKHSAFWPEAGGTVGFKYESNEPAVAPQPLVFEGTWLPGGRGPAL